MKNITTQTLKRAVAISIILMILGIIVAQSYRSHINHKGTDSTYSHYNDAEQRNCARRYTQAADGTELVDKKYILCINGGESDLVKIYDVRGM